MADYASVNVGCLFRQVDVHLGIKAWTVNIDTMTGASAAGGPDEKKHALAHRQLSWSRNGRTHF